MGDDVSHDDAGTSSSSPNRPSGGPLGFFGPGGLFDWQGFLINLIRPQGGGASGSSPGSTLSDPTVSSDDVKPVFEVNVQDTVQDVVSSNHRKLHR